MEVEASPAQRLLISWKWF